jgi:hypothetical protein
MVRTLAALLAAVVVTLAGPAARAQDYPTRPVKIIVPFAVGGPADVYARFLGARLTGRDGPAVRDREPAGRRRGHRHRRRREVRARRLHAAAHVQRAYRQRDADPEQAVCAAARFRARGARQLFGPGARRQSRGARRTRWRSSSRSRRRSRASSTTRRRARERRITWPASSSSRWRAWTSCTSRTRRARRAHRRAGRPGGHDVRRGDDDERAGEGRQGAAAGDERQVALRGDADRADRVRGRRAGLRGGDLAGRHGAQGHAGRDREPSERGNQQDREPPRDVPTNGRSRVRRG